jgi:hypothetical protein
MQTAKGGFGMKRLQCVVLAAILVLGSVSAAGAVDVKVKGTWDFVFGWTDNKDFNDQDGEDDFVARSRFRTQANFIVSEQLQGVLFFEIGTLNWGRSATNNIGSAAGGSIDTDGVNVKTKHAYIDWTIPSTEVAVRLGLQPIVMPNATKRGNPVLNSDVAAAVVSIPFNPQVGLTLAWARPFDQNLDDGTTGSVADEMDILGAILTIKGEGWSLTPWAAYSSIGANSGFFEYAIRNSPIEKNFGSGTTFKGSDTSDVWWAGFALAVDAFDPLTFAIDAMYGHAGEVDLDIGAAEDFEFETSGWLIAATVDYKLDWGSVGLFGWYASGDDKDDVEDNEWGQLPTIGYDTGFGFGTYGYSSAVTPTGVGDYNTIGTSSLGSWGIGVQAADWSFVDKLSHTLRFIYLRGTNDSDVVKLFRDNFGSGPLAFSGERVYLTDEDQAFEVDFVTKYQIYDNLTAFLDLAWVHMDLDEDVWGDDAKDDDAWKAQLVLRYAF